MRAESMRPSLQAVPFLKPGLQHWLGALFMAAVAAIAWWMMPHITWYEHLGKPVFEEVIPARFADWVVDEGAGASHIVDPQQQDAVAEIYTQVVSRTYLHQPSGRRIMLSLAYGDDQTYKRQLHRPESCYSSNGLSIKKIHEEPLQVPGKAIAVNRMTAGSSFRTEQVTYFIRIGDRVISGPPFELNKARMAMGLKGYKADGLLFRVSELTGNAEEAMRLQDRFINDLLGALSPAQKTMLIGPDASS